MSTSDTDRSQPNGASAPPAQDMYPFATPVAYLRPPRLGIIHLLAWMTTTAVVMSFHALMNQSGSSTPPAASVEIRRWVVEFRDAVLVGAGLVGLTVVLLAKARREAGRLQPGHWLVAVMSLSTLAHWAINRAIYVLVMGASLEHYRLGQPWIFGLHGLVGLAAGGVYFYLACGRRESRRWQIVFGFLTVRSLICVGQIFAGRFTISLSAFVMLLTPTLVTPIALVVTSWLDLRRGPRRDWVHWLGVAMVLIGDIWFVANWVFLRLFGSFMP